jgi:type IV pilus biogenesis/stability protein PilW
VLLALLMVQACAPIGEKAAQDKRKANAARNLGEAYISEGNYTGALKELLKAEKLNPDDPLLHNDLGLVYMAKDKFDRAVAHFEKAIELQPDYSLAKNNLGSAYMIRKEWDKAIPILEDVTGDMLYATPHFPLTNLGWAYFNKGDYDKAQRYLKQALKLKPDFFLARLHMGQTLLATGRLHQALTMFEQLAAERPKDPALLLELGKAYRLLGDYDSARLALKGAIEFTENNELAVEASEELKKLYR